MRDSPDGGESTSPIVRVGIWGPLQQDIMQGMADDGTPLSYEAIDSLDETDVSHLDCLVVTVTGAERRLKRLRTRLDAKFQDIPVLYILQVPTEEQGTTAARNADDVLVIGASMPYARINRSCERRLRGDRIHRSGRIHWSDRSFVILWLLALLTYGVGDLVTTVWGVVYTPGIGESNPIVAALLETYGGGGFIILKLLVFLLLVLLSVRGVEDGNRFNALWPPVLAIVVGVLLTGWNLVTILS